MHLFYYPIADSYWLVAAIAAALLAIIVLVGPGRSRISLRRRLTLALIRCGIIALVVLGMLRPTLVYLETHKENATLVLLIDQSRSMQVRDALNNKSRWESLREKLDECVPELRKLDRATGGDFEVKVYTFDAETHPQEIKSGRIALPDVARRPADGHRRGAGRRAPPGERQAAVGDRAPHRRPAAGPAAPRSARAGSRQPVAAPRLPGLSGRLRRVARAGRCARRGCGRLPAARGCLRQYGNVRPRRSQDQRLRQQGDSRAAAHGPLRRQNGSHRRDQAQSDDGWPAYARRPQVTLPRFPANTS